MVAGISASMATAMAQQSSTTFSGDQFGVSGAQGLNVNNDSLVVQATNIMNAIFILLGFVATLFIIYAGIRLIVSRGQEDAMKEAKQILLYAVAGFALILVSWGIVRLIVSLLLAGNTSTGGAPFSGEYSPAGN